MRRGDPNNAIIREDLTRLLRLLEKLEPGPVDRSGIPADVWMSDTEVVIRFEIPGADPASLRLSGHRCFLELSGTRVSRSPQRGRYLIAERMVGPFRKAIELPSPVDLSRVQADLADGLMTVRVPRVLERRGERHALAFTVSK